VQEHYGFEIGATAVRIDTLRHARRAQQKLQAHYEEPYRVLPAKGQAYVIAQADGSMICTVARGRRQSKRPRDWEEIRLLAAQAKDSTQTIYGVTFDTVQEAGRRWGHCARQAGWGLNTHIHAQGDGAEWIRLQTHEVFGAQASFLCDFFHVSDYLAEAAPVCRPAQHHAWRRTQQKRLRSGAVQKVLTSLAEHLEPEGTPDEEAPVSSAYRYINNRLDCLDYPRALRLGLPIGSGLIESGHRHVLQARLKKAGAAWLREHADQLAHLRVLRANHQWESLWN
jgi:hypothetical protein